MLSKYPLDKKTENRIFEIFFKSLAKIKNEDQARDFADDFFTRTEEKMLAKRISIAFLLTKEYQVRSICELLKVSSGTVNSVSAVLKYKQGMMKKIINQIIKDEKLEKFFRDLAYNLEINLPPRYQSWTRWRKGIEQDRRKAQKPFSI